MDRIDGGILAHLQNNARLSNKELAARVGLAPSSCLERVRRLQQSGVLQGFHARVDPAALGIGLQALIAVRLTQHSRHLVRKFREHIRPLPEITAVFHVAGENDFLLQVAVRDVDHLRNFALDALTGLQEVAHLETTLVFEHEPRRVLPDYSAGDSAARGLDGAGPRG
jgi:DNA-binding Lrp family transcriptional regulator